MGLCVTLCDTNVFKCAWNFECFDFIMCELVVGSDCFWMWVKITDYNVLKKDAMGTPLRSVSHVALSIWAVKLEFNRNITIKLIWDSLDLVL